jgi:hypothetical protein
MEPRIYVYKITFQEAPLYYIGVHKEKTFNEEYMGSPITHKEKWQIYNPQKEILKEFDYTDDGWLQAQEFEKELIRPVYNTDINCLNESCGIRISLAINRATGKKVWENKTPEQRSDWARKINENRTTEQRSAIAKKVNASRTPEQRRAAAKKARATYQANSTPEQISASAKSRWANMTPDQRSAFLKKGNATRFQCTVTGRISNAGALTHYQRARGIDTSKRVKVISS